MEIAIERQNEIGIVKVGGRLDAGGAPALETQGRALVREGAKRLLLDLAGIDYVSSAGLRALLVLAKTSQSAGGALALCGLTPAVREILAISGFDSILPLAADRAAGLTLLK